MKLSLICLGLLAVILTSCGGGKKDETSNEPLGCQDHTTCATPTIYITHTVDLGDFSCEAGELVSVKDRNRQEIVRICEVDYDILTLNGSARVYSAAETYTLGYLSPDYEEGGHLFFKRRDQACEFACGSSGLCVEPYYSIAADTTIYPYGTLVYVRQADGVTLPDGQVHDGVFRVDDTGDEIKGQGRFDFYTGFLDHTTNDNPLVPLGFSDTRTKLDYEVVEWAEPGQVSAQRECWADQER